MRFLFLTLILIYGASSFADCNNNYCGDVKIEELYINVSGPIYVSTSGDERKLNCTTVSNGGTHLNLNTNPDSNYKDVYSALLAAQKSDSSVSIRIEDESNGCNILYIRSY